MLTALGLVVVIERLVKLIGHAEDVVEMLTQLLLAQPHSPSFVSQSHYLCHVLLLLSIEGAFFFLKPL